MKKNLVALLAVLVLSGCQAAQAGERTVAEPVEPSTQASVVVAADVSWTLDAPVVVVTADPKRQPSSVRAIVAQVLAEQGMSDVEVDYSALSPNEPIRAGVLPTNGSYLMVNEQRMLNQGLSRQHIRDIVLHETVHLRQVRLGGGSAYNLSDWLDPIFSGNALEHSADCAALALGAHSAVYNADCDGPGVGDAVARLLS